MNRSNDIEFSPIPLQEEEESLTSLNSGVIDLKQLQNDGDIEQQQFNQEGGEGEQREQVIFSQVTIEDETHNNAPHYPLWKLFWVFLNFGIRAFGGPVAQINMMKEQLVINEKWITVARFF